MKVRSYPCKILRVHDGDTVFCEIDQGFGNTKKDNIRLSGIDAPELKEGDHALDSKVYLEQFIGRDLIIHTQKTDKYGRYLGTFYFYGKESGPSINELMISLGLAKPYNGGKK